MSVSSILDDEKYKIRHWGLNKKTGQVYPIKDVLDWARFFEKTENRRIAEDEGSLYRVSTVFIGLESEWFETMVFETKENKGNLFGKNFTYNEDMEQIRCGTIEDARRIHQEQVAIWISSIDRPSALGRLVGLLNLRLVLIGRTLSQWYTRLYWKWWRTRRTLLSAGASFMKRLKRTLKGS